MNAANLPGRLLPNRFAGRLGVHNQMIVSAAICGAFCFLFLVMKNVASLVLIAIFYGFASGACSVLSFLSTQSFSDGDLLGCRCLAFGTNACGLG